MNLSINPRTAGSASRARAANPGVREGGAAGLNAKPKNNQGGPL